ncbi:MAG: DUF5752 family protein [bacterium]|nr:DUF5752 family protein [bacterium]
MPTFHFNTRRNLLELTGLKARNIKELLEGLRSVPRSVIYYHTHHYLQQHQYLYPEPPNDFAYWVREVLGEKQLGEELFAIDLCQFPDLERLRDRIIALLEKYLEKNNLITVHPGAEFHFIRSISFVFPTLYQADNLAEFVQALKKVSIHSLYFHIFEATVRLGKNENDFSRWLRESLHEDGLADRITRLDPYTQTMEGLRNRICSLVEARIKDINNAQAR